jgi:hypothetical protein
VGLWAVTGGRGLGRMTALGMGDMVGRLKVEKAEWREVREGG